MGKLEDAQNPHLTFAEQASDIATPPAGMWAVFFKSGGLYVIDDSGTVVGPFSAATGATPELLHVREEQASGTQGGTFTSGAWRTRTLNTVKTNEITGASLASNQVTLPAGTYEAAWSAPARQVNAHQSRLYDITNAVALIVGGNNTAANGTTLSGSRSTGFGRFTLAAEAVVELQHQGSITQATTGLGSASGFGIEVYADLRIRKIS